MEFQGISEMNRARMVDWMIQVFRVFKKSCAKTFLLAQYYMDEYFRKLQSNEKLIDRTKLHLIGLVCIFIASKFEDIRPIRLRQILVDAGHEKFSKEEVLAMEQEIIRTLEYHLNVPNPLEDAVVLLKSFLQRYVVSAGLSDENEKLLVTYLEFVTYLSAHSISLIQIPASVAVPATLLVGLKYLKIALLVKVQALKQQDTQPASATLDLKQAHTQLSVVKVLASRIKQELKQESKQKSTEVYRTT